MKINMSDDKQEVVVALTLDEGNLGGANMTQYTCWKSDTCYVCSGGTGKPNYHARMSGYEVTSSCDTVPVVVNASSRQEALRLFKEMN